MRILVLSEMFPRPTNPVLGGFVLSECKALSRHGVRFGAISPIPYSPRLLWRYPRWRRYGEIPPRARWHSIPARYPRYPRIPGAFYRKFEPFAMFPSLCASFRKWSRENSFDLIHAHGLLPCGMAAILLSRTFGIPCVCQARGSDVHIYPRESKANFLLTRYVIENCDAPAAVSKDLAKKMSSISRSSRPINILYTTVDTGLFAPAADKARLRQRLGIHPKAFVAIYVGSLTIYKGIADLAEVWKNIAEKLPNSLLVIIGDGPLSPRLASLGPAVLLCGPRPHTEVASWMQASDLLLLPSYSEGLPTVILEAMACELPVVATSVGGIPEAAFPGETGLLVPAGDRQSLASSIINLAQNEARRRSMGDAGRRRILSLFGQEKYVSEARALYREVLEITSSRGRAALRRER